MDASTFLSDESTSSRCYVLIFSLLHRRGVRPFPDFSESARALTFRRWNGKAETCLRADYRMVMLTRLPSPWKILKSVESCTSVFPFSMREMYDFFVPIFAASCSCVSPALRRSSFSRSARMNASASRSKRSRSGVTSVLYVIITDYP